MGNENSTFEHYDDKRTARKKHGDLFQQVIAHYKRNLKKQKLSFPEEKENDKNIQVYVRKRPIFQHEIKKNEYDIITCHGGKIVVVHDCRMSKDNKPDNAFVVNYKFSDFDGVFDENTNNEQVYNTATKSLIKFVTSGNIGTCFMYGQTGSGKTYTMNGIHEKAVIDLFNQIDTSKIKISVSCFEMAGNSSYDLLNNRSPIQLMEGKDKNVHLMNCSELDVTDAKELYELINAAMKSRNTQATGVNSQSSRSHCIIRIFLRLRNNGKIYGQLTLVDLAGSERNADSFYHNADRRRECSQINYSLMTLKDCIRIRAENIKNGTKKHIPYRSSKLSHFLKECFTSKKNSRTVVIATFSPIPTDTEHTINTLQHTCMMLMKKDADQSKLTVREVLNYKSKETPAPIPLQQWTGEKCRNWLVTVENSRFKKYVDRFPSHLDGRQLVRFTEKRFAQIVGDENIGIALRRAVQNEIDKVNAYKAQRLKDNKQLLRGKNI